MQDLIKNEQFKSWREVIETLKAGMMTDYRRYPEVYHACKVGEETNDFTLLKDVLSRDPNILGYAMGNLKILSAFFHAVNNLNQRLYFCLSRFAYKLLQSFRAKFFSKIFFNAEMFIPAIKDLHTGIAYIFNPAVREIDLMPQSGTSDLIIISRWS